MPKTDDRVRRLAHQLSHKSTDAERIDALVDIGFSLRELAQVVGVSDESVRTWRNKTSTPRDRHSDALDDLRAVTLILLKGDVPPERIRKWFRSTPPLSAPRPIDVIASDPQAVAAAAAAELEEDYEVMAELLQAARLPVPAAERETRSSPDGEPDAAPAQSPEATESARRKRVRAQRRALAP